MTGLVHNGQESPPHVVVLKQVEDLQARVRELRLQHCKDENSEVCDVLEDLSHDVLRAITRLERIN